MRDNEYQELYREEARAETQWQVIAGNAGTVYTGGDDKLAKQAFDQYVELSKAGSGRVAGEPVSLWCDGELHDEYDPAEPEDG
jgi:hypothetical protein